MENFEFVSPTHFVFGHDAEQQVGSKLAERGARKVLLHYGGQSALRSGLVDKIKASLGAEGLAYVTLGGVVPNPRLSLIREGIELARTAGFGDSNNDEDMLRTVGCGVAMGNAKECVKQVADAITDTNEEDGVATFIEKHVL